MRPHIADALAPAQTPPDFLICLDNPNDPDGFGALEFLSGLYPDSRITVIFSPTLQNPNYNPNQPSSGFDPEATQRRAVFDAGRFISLADHARMDINPSHIQFFYGVPGSTEYTIMPHEGDELVAAGLKTVIPYPNQTDSREIVRVDRGADGVFVSNYDVFGDALSYSDQAGTVTEALDRLKAGRGLLWCLGIGPLRELDVALQVPDIRRRVAGIALQGAITTSPVAAARLIYSSHRGYNFDSSPDAADKILGLAEIPIAAVGSDVSRSPLASWPDVGQGGIDGVDAMIADIGPENADPGLVLTYRVHREAARQSLATARREMPVLGPHDTLAALLLTQMMGDGLLLPLNHGKPFTLKKIASKGVSTPRSQTTGLALHPDQVREMWRNIIGPTIKASRRRR